MRYRPQLDALPDDAARIARLVELNVVLQVYQLSLNPTVRDAWKDGRELALHGVVYNIETGLLQSVLMDVDGLDSAQQKLAAFRPD